MKIVHQKGTNFITFFPKGKFYSKVNTMLSLINHKILILNDRYEIIKKRSNKKHITFIPLMLKHKPKDVLIIYKYGTKHNKTYVNKKGFTKRTNVNQLGQKQQDSFKIISEFYHFITTEKLNKNNLVKFAMTNLIENYRTYQLQLADESEPWPLHSISFKFIY